MIKEKDKKEVLREYAKEIIDQIEKESRAPMPLQRIGYGKQLDRIERMLKWLIVHKEDDLGYFMEGKTYHAGKKIRMLPDIGDILDDVELK